VLDRAELGGEPFMVLRRQPCLGVGAIALHRDLARRHVGPFALRGEPCAPFNQLRPALPGLGQTLGQVTLDLVDARDLATERFDPLGHRGEIDPARRELGAERRLV